MVDHNFSNLKYSLKTEKKHENRPNPIFSRWKKKRKKSVNPSHMCQFDSFCICIVRRVKDLGFLFVILSQWYRWIRGGLEEIIYYEESFDLLAVLKGTTYTLYVEAGGELEGGGVNIHAPLSTFFVFHSRNKVFSGGLLQIKHKKSVF